MGQAEINDLAVVSQLPNGPHGGISLQLGAIVVGKVKGDESCTHNHTSCTVFLDYTTPFPTASTPGKQLTNRCVNGKLIN